MNQTISYWDISEKQRLLRVNLSIINDGEVLLFASSGFTWIQQMKPWPEVLLNSQNDATTQESKFMEIPWPLIAEKIFENEREIEPRELEEIHMDFVMDKSYEQVLIYSFIENATKPGRHFGWEVTTIISFDKEQEQQAQTMSKQIPDKRQAQAKPRPGPATPPLSGKTGGGATQSQTLGQPRLGANYPKKGRP